MSKVRLFNTLEDLKEDDFKKFKWHLCSNPKGIKVCRLEKADRQDTVDVMVQTYGFSEALKVAHEVLEKLKMRDLAQNLPCKDVTLQVSEPLQPITYYQQKLQSNLQDKFMCAQEGWTKKKDEQPLDDIYTEVYITVGGEVHISQQHEVMQIEMAGKQAGTEKPIKPSDMFKPPSGKYRAIRTVLTSGIAGIGKTFLVRKFVLDWVEGRANKDVDLIFPFTFRQLNLLKGKKFCLAELIHTCIRETKDIKNEALNDIFKKLQASGNTNFDKSEFKLLFVLDGLDESHLQLECSTNEKPEVDFDVTTSDSVDVLLTNLIRKNLLPSARLWITTRPTAASQIHSDFIDIMTEVRGFTDPQKEGYFRKRFREEEQASRIISHIKSSRSIHIMCHIPVFCWITATVLEDVLKTSEGRELPTTLTEMYTEFLVFQIDQAKSNFKNDNCIQHFQSLAKLAFHQLEKGNLIFYEKDLKESGIEVSGASMYSGVFTEIFKEEHGKMKDEDKMFSFVHLSVQEFLAALHVEMSLINGNRNVMSEPEEAFKRLWLLFTRASTTEVHRVAIDKALQSPNGHLDLFLRFLLGLSVQTKHTLLRGLLTKKRSSSETSKETAEYIKKKINKNPSPERIINLFHCLNELNHHSLEKEIQQYLHSGSLSAVKLSPAHWSALAFILLSSEKDLDVFDLKKYSASEDALLKLLPVVKASNRALLRGCNLSGRSCEVLAPVLSSQSSSLRELDLSFNNLQDSGVKLLCAGLESPHCRLEALRLTGCKVSWGSCEALATILSSQSSNLRELDLSNNDLQDSGVKLLSSGLESPHCTLDTLRLSGCQVSKEGCAALALALSSNPSYLRELDLSYNHPGDSGRKLLSAGLKNPQWGLSTLRVDDCGEQRLKPGVRKYACELTLDPNTVNRNLKLSNNNRKATWVDEEQLYPDHPERFSHSYQLLCSNGLTGRCYWEVNWNGDAVISVAYRGINRRGDGDDGRFGKNVQSWSLECSEVNCYSVCHDNKRTDIVLPHTLFHRVAVYLDWPAGILSFYRVTLDKHIHLHTFTTTFTEPLYPGFGLWFLCGFPSSVALCEL
ncbi:NACHT, LRR and PYD domains-containing protein 12-like isoform X2 [Dicentrarchus labrax]|uniref:NACHT, LRR and PYD domains-containing protein 12-like isoform X2 n=1 Tax=Dicentrarchus labrax TaxID=13489 RepID=UPI0021F5CAC9|nr:NACHT, LRR and PYD domains-containing protein 12-like isoform X2 [Dicentrarchus labrax]